MLRKSKHEIVVLLAPGFDEVGVSDTTCTLRDSGLPVLIVGLVSGPIRGNYGLSLVPDASLSAIGVRSPQAVILPGGMQCVQQLESEPRVHTLLRRVVSRGGYIVALDSAYRVLQRAGMLDEIEPSQGTDVGTEWEQEKAADDLVVLEGPIILGQRARAACAAAVLVCLIEAQQSSGPHVRFEPIGDTC